jgi:thiamine-monophosphate kinase
LIPINTLNDSIEQISRIAHLRRYAAERVQKQRNKSKATTSDPDRGELAILRAIRERTIRNHTGNSGRSGVRLGIGDDCALLRLRAGEELAVTTDLSIEGRHFRLDWHPPESVGHRTLARGLSDLAAMGARPVAAFLSLGLPPKLAVADRSTRSWVDRFFDGLLALAAEYDVPLAGGDLAESPVAIADIVLTGAVPRGKALLRSGARIGDRIYVTGSLGGAAAELASLAASPKRFAKQTMAASAAPHLYPQPRLAQGLWLRKRGLASAAMDLSDGLSTDLSHLCEESGVAAEIGSEALPLGKNATIAMALHGGEDYELLFTAPASAHLPRQIAGVAITPIGWVLAPKRGHARITLLTGSKSEPLEPHGWQHFSNSK